MLLLFLAHLNSKLLWSYQVDAKLIFSHAVKHYSYKIKTTMLPKKHCSAQFYLT